MGKFSKFFSSLNNREKSNNRSYTHFFSVPFIDETVRLVLKDVQYKIMRQIDRNNLKFCSLNNPNLFHLTLCMLSLNDPIKRFKTLEIFEENKEEIEKTIKFPNIEFNFDKITCFSEESPKRLKKNDIIFLQPNLNEILQSIHEISHILIKDLLKFKIINYSDLKTLNLMEDELGFIRMSNFHLTLARITDINNIEMKSIINNLKKDYKAIQIPFQSLDISTRFEYDENDKFYKVLGRQKIERKK